MGGIASALCLLLMMLTIIPIATYTMPALAGMVLIVVVIENGYSTAWMVYAAVGFLSLFICPDKEAAMLFVGFFRLLSYLKREAGKNQKKVDGISFQIFHLQPCDDPKLSGHHLPVRHPDILEDVGPLGKIQRASPAADGQCGLFVYDIALSRIITAYRMVLRKKIFRRVGQG